MPVSVVWLLCQLVRHLWKYRQADIVFHEEFMGNFGGGVQNTQIARRHHKGRKIIVSYLYEMGSNHNPKLGLIYPDVLFLMIRKPCFVLHINGRKYRIPSDEVFIPVKEAMSNFFMSVFAPETDYQAYVKLAYYQQIPPELEGVIPDNYEDAAMRSFYTFVLWSGHLKEDYQDPSMQRLALPEPLRREIREKLKVARHGREARLCMSYNKLEEKRADYPRRGSPIEAYLPAFRSLVAQGYQVLLAGDRSLEQSQIDEFDGMVVNAQSLDVDEDLFLMFAPTESDICIGEPGAGVLLPLIVGTPVLILNYSPFGIGAPGRWVYPKRYVDAAGNTVPYQRAMEEDLYGIWSLGRKEPAQISPVCNSEEEITEAVEYFLEDLASPSDMVPGEELVALAPKVSSFYSYGSRFSPAFVRRDRMVSNEEPAEKAMA